MKEAEVIGLCQYVELQDIGRKLSKGDLLYLREDEVARSSSLALARKNNAVSFRWVTRCQSIRPAASPAVMPSSGFPAVPVQLKEDPMASEDLARLLLTQLRVEFAMLREEIRALAAKQSVVSVQSGSGVSGVAPSDLVLDAHKETPMFIPSPSPLGVVDLAVESDSSATGGAAVDTAAEALRRLRGRRGP